MTSRKILSLSSLVATVLTIQCLSAYEVSLKEGDFFIGVGADEYLERAREQATKDVYRKIVTHTTEYTLDIRNKSIVNGDERKNLQEIFEESKSLRIRVVERSDQFFKEDGQWIYRVKIKPVLQIDNGRLVEEVGFDYFEINN